MSPVPHPVPPFAADDLLPATTDAGRLGVYGLRRLWARWDALAKGVVAGPNYEHRWDHLVLDALGVGLEQALVHLRTFPSFPDFEDWIEQTTGGLDPFPVARLNAVLAGEPAPERVRAWLATIDSMAPVLSSHDLRQWDELGYVIVREVVDVAARTAAVEAITAHIGADLDDADTWYAPNDHGIMVQLFQHPALDVTRGSPRLHKAFAQLWGTADLWVSADRVGFNPPERPGYTFGRWDLHWDVSLVPPIAFGTQGIVYLTDTEAEQGALTVVPGFHRRAAEWLVGLGPHADPRAQDLHALGSEAIAAAAGDAVIWHQALPHGSRPNRTDRPRIVQYVNRYPIDYEEQDTWR